MTDIRVTATMRIPIEDIRDMIDTLIDGDLPWYQTIGWIDDYTLRVVAWDGVGEEGTRCIERHVRIAPLVEAFVRRSFSQSAKAYRLDDYDYCDVDAAMQHVLYGDIVFG